MFNQIIVNGFIASSVYVLVGLSFGIIYSTTGIFHLAHVAIFTFGGLGFYQMIVAWQQPFILSFMVSILFTSFLGVLIDQICYRPMQEHQASTLHIFLTSLGIMIVMQNIALLIWKSDPHVVPISQWFLKGRQWGGIRITYLQVITMAIALCIWGIIHLFMFKSKTGKAIRAFTADQETTQGMGIDVQRLRLIIYSLGSALIAVVAIFQIMDLGIDTSTGFGIVILGVIASLIGGMWGMTGIALSSLALGFIENIGLLIFSVHWKYTILFGTLIVLLIFRPKAIFKGLQN